MPKVVISAGEALLRAHAALMKDLRKLGAAVRSQPNRRAGAMVGLLTKARTHLTDHFRFEEQDGYMGWVLQKEPQRSRTVKELEGEHRELADSLDALIDEAKAGKTRGEAFRGEVEAWIARVQDHESRENELVQEVLNLDCSGED